MSFTSLPATTQSLAPRELRAALPAVLTCCVMCAAFVLGRPVSAAPTDGHIRAGDASVSTQAGTTHVEQRSARAIIDWKTFNVSQGEAVVFNQPSADAIVLNRVTGSTRSSSILGSMTANGRVFIVNPVRRRVRPQRAGQCGGFGSDYRQHPERGLHAGAP